MLNDLLDDINAVLKSHGLKVIRITTSVTAFGTPVPEHPIGTLKPRSDAGSDVATQPKDYPEEGGTQPLPMTDLQRKRNRLAALISKGKP